MNTMARGERRAQGGDALAKTRDHFRFRPGREPRLGDPGRNLGNLCFAS